MLLSVVMPVYNETLKEINESINSILNQSFTNFEFIIIDDNPLSAKLKNYLLNKSKQDKRIKILYNVKNIGPSRSTNKGIKYSNGKLIARMDADDISLKNRFDSQIKFINKYKLDFACFNFSLISCTDSIEKRNCYTDITETDQNEIKRIMSFCSITNGPSFMFKKNIIPYVGGYRIECIEDYDFATRVLVNGFKVGYQSKSYLYKRDRKNNVTNSNALKQFVGVMAISRYLRKYHFHKFIPIELLKRKINNISNKNLHKFHLVKSNLYKFKTDKSISSLVKLLILLVSSKLILKFYLWNKSLGTKWGQNILIRFKFIH